MDEEDLLEEIRNDDSSETSEDEPPFQPENAEPKKSSSRGSRRKDDRGVSSVVKIGVVVALLGGGVTALLLGTDIGNVFVYSKLVDEVMDEPDEFVGREVRVEGQLRQGSVRFEAEPNCAHRFVLTRGEHEMPVLFPRCVVPDTFRDGIEMDVVVQGQLQQDHTFLASEIIPRCPSKYEMRQRQQDGESMPHLAPIAGETS